MTCIALSGYYGFHNVGDEAILEVVTGILRRRLPGVELVVFSADPVYTRRTYGVEAVSRTHLPSIVRTLRRADLLISGGGGLLQDLTSFRSVAYYLGIMELALLMGKKVAVFAQGVGPLQHRLALRWVKRVLSRVDLVSVRDPLSASFLADLGVRRDIQVTADPVFSLEPASKDEIEAFWSALGWADRNDEKAGNVGKAGKDGRGKEQLTVGVALRPFPRETDFGTGVMEAVTRACMDLQKEYRARLVFLPYHLGKDLPLAREIASRLSGDTLIMDRSLSVREVMCLIGGLDLLVGMRLHALIFAAVSGVPFVALPYDPKINAFLSCLGKEPSPPLQELTLARLRHDLHSLIDGQKKDVRSELQSRVQELKKEVERAAGQLLSLLPG